MAEAALSLVIDNLLIPLLSEEANLLKGIHKEVRGLKDELESIRCFLRSADARAELDDGVKLWVKLLNEAAMKIENVIDEYTYDIGRQWVMRREESHARRCRLKFVNFVRKVSCLICELKPRHDITIKIQELKQEVQDINERGKTYNFERSVLHQIPSDVAPRLKWYDPREKARHLEENEVIGVQNDIKELVARLEASDLQHEVVAIVGMGGIGKTTIAHRVFNDVKKKFECHAWIVISQTYDETKVLRNLTKQVYQSRNELVPEGINQETDLYTLRKRLRDYLEGKSYIVTFDDVWETSFGANIEIVMSTSNSENENHRGRIIITTRNEEVADFCRMSSLVHVHRMKLLTFESSMELFCKKVFHLDENILCPAELEDLCRQVVKKCGGLPFAIVVFGGLFATKNNNIGEWTKLVESLSTELESNQHLVGINKILSPSYNDLPNYLRPCLLYFGIYPEDSIVEKERLVRQWIAEGFVRQQKDTTLEVIAEEYLSELINRSMVQVSIIDHDTGEPTYCHVHDHMRDFILTKTNVLCFCQALSKKDNSYFVKSSARSRRISIFDDAMVETNIVRSVFVFSKEEITDHLWSKISTSFKFLKVLDFEKSSISRLPNDIGNVFHLRYLGLRNSRVEFIPKSIGKLENLETLDLRSSKVVELPIEINKLHKLRHLILSHRGGGVKLKKGFGSLRALQTLDGIDGDVDRVDVVEEIGKLRELRVLRINNLRSKEEATMCSCIQNLKHLESFNVQSRIEEYMQPIDLESVKSPPKSLRRLSLTMRLKNFPSWISKLESLVKIEIYRSKLQDDPLPFLQILPNLVHLRICGEAYRGEKLEFKIGTFLKLKNLTLVSLSKLNTLVIQQGALTNLEMFNLKFCPQLKKMPSSSLNELKYLKHILFYNLPVPLLLSHDFHSIQHVPRVVIWFYKSQEKRDLSWVIRAQGYVSEDEKEEWASLTFEDLLSKVDQIDAESNSSERAKKNMNSVTEGEIEEKGSP